MQRKLYSFFLINTIKKEIMRIKVLINLKNIKYLLFVGWLYENNFKKIF